MKLIIKSTLVENKVVSTSLTHNAAHPPCPNLSSILGYQDEGGARCAGTKKNRGWSSVEVPWMGSVQEAGTGTRRCCAHSCCQIQDKYSIPSKMLIALGMHLVHYNLTIIPKRTSTPINTRCHHDPPAPLSMLSAFF